MSEPESSPQELETARFSIALAEALHRRGLPAHRLEDAMTGLSRELGQQAAFFSTPTSLLIRFGAPEASRTTLLRVEPAGGARLGKLADLDRLADRVAVGHVRITDGLVALREIEEGRELYPRTLSAVATGMLSAAACVFFAGTALEVLVAGGLGLVVGLLEVAIFARWTRGRSLQELMSAFVVAMLAAAIAPSVRPPLVVLTGLIGLVPGLSLTTAVAELATRNLVSGTARLTATALSFLQLGVGVALAGRLSGEVWSVPVPSGMVLPGWALWPALATAGLSIQILYAAHLRHLPWVLVSALVSVLAARLGGSTLGADLGPLLGALGAGLVGNIGARLLRRPAVIGILPGLLLLVPGSLGVRALTSLLQEDTLVGVSTTVSMLVVAVALVTGLLSANILVSPRRSL